MSATCGELATADTVIEATVEQIQSRPGFDMREPDDPAGFSYGMPIVRLKDVISWRGDAPTMILDGPGDCERTFKAGTRYLIATHRNARGQHTVSMCSFVREISEAQPYLDFLKAIKDGSREARAIGTISKRTGLGYADATQPLAGAEVTVSGPAQFTRVSSASGAFEIRNLPPGGYAVSARVSGVRVSLNREIHDFAIEDAPACVDIDIVVPASGRVRGAVVDAAGSPIRDVFVMFRSADRGDQDTRHPGFGLTLRDGTYSLPDIPPGRYRVTLNEGEGPSQNSPFAETVSPVFVVEEGKATTAPLLRAIHTSKIKVSGVVQDAGGVPVSRVALDAVLLLGNGEHAKVVARPETDAQGRFEFELWKDQRYLITIGPDHDPAARLEFVADGRRLAITARRN
jgi:hypothetical protein